MTDQCSLIEFLPCDRCPGVDRILRPMYEGSQTFGYWCPCCKSTLRTGAMIESEVEARATALGITRDELFEQTKEMFRDFEAEPPSDAEKAQMTSFAQRSAAEWTPVCEHDKNPWTTPVGEL